MDLSTVLTIQALTEINMLITLIGIWVAYKW